MLPDKMKASGLLLLLPLLHHQQHSPGHSAHCLLIVISTTKEHWQTTFWCARLILGNRCHCCCCCCRSSSFCLFCRRRWCCCRVDRTRFCIGLMQPLPRQCTEMASFSLAGLYLHFNLICSSQYPSLTSGPMLVLCRNLPHYKLLQRFVGNLLFILPVLLLLLLLLLLPLPIVVYHSNYSYYYCYYYLDAEKRNQATLQQKLPVKGTSLCVCMCVCVCWHAESPWWLCQLCQLRQSVRQQLQHLGGSVAVHLLDLSRAREDCWFSTTAEATEALDNNLPA